MTTIFQRHAGAEFAQFARERMVREQESRRDAETAEAFRALVTQEGTDARSADATQGDACDLPSYLRDWTRRVLLIIAEDPSDPRIRQAVVGLNALAVRSTNAQR